MSFRYLRIVCTISTILIALIITFIGRIKNSPMRVAVWILAVGHLTYLVHFIIQIAVQFGAREGIRRYRMSPLANEVHTPTKDPASSAEK
jgi:hypothetical protein